MCHGKTEQEDKQVEEWRQAGSSKESGAMGCPDALANAGHLLVSMLTWVLLAKMEVPDIWVFLLTASSTSSGNLCCYQGWCVVSQVDLHSFPGQVKSSINQVLSTTYCLIILPCLSVLCGLNSGCCLSSVDKQVMSAARCTTRGMTSPLSIWLMAAWASSRHFLFGVFQ